MQSHLTCSDRLELQTPKCARKTWNLIYWSDASNKCNEICYCLLRSQDSTPITLASMSSWTMYVQHIRATASTTKWTNAMLCISCTSEGWSHLSGSTDNLIKNKYWLRRRRTKSKCRVPTTDFACMHRFRSANANVGISHWDTRR